MKLFNKYWILAAILAVMPVLLLSHANAEEEQGTLPNGGEPASVGQIPAALTLSELSLAVDISPGNEAVRQGAEHLGGLVIRPGGVFSLNHWRKELEAANQVQLTDEELERLGSVLLKAAVQAGLEVGGYTSHKQLPEGIEPGYDVHFERDKQDFLLYNPHAFEVRGGLEAAGGKARFRLLGNVISVWSRTEVKVKVEEFQPEQIILTDYAANAKKKTVPGHRGQLVSVYGTTAASGERLLYKSYYPPQPSLVYTPRETAPPEGVGGGMNDAAR
jgi:hypothetical protein